MSQKVKFTVLIVDDRNQPFVAVELSEHEPGMSKVQMFIEGNTMNLEAATLLMIAATAAVEPHQRVKLLAMIAENAAIIDFEHLASWKPSKD